MTKPWSLAYASFSRRALARLVDLGVVLALCAALYFFNRTLGFPVKYTSLFKFVRPESATMFMTTDFPGVLTTFVAIKLLLAYPYFALMESSSRQATLGKIAMDIKVSDIDGNRISFGRATGRYFLKTASATLFALGYVVSFSDRRQTWHDYIAKTLVIRKNVFPAYYALPRIGSVWMFDLPGFARRTAGALPGGYVCISCNFEAAEKSAGCPACGRPFGYVEVGVLRGLLVMNGVLFTIIGGFLSYLTFSVINERLLDDHIGREGTPWGIIFIMSMASLASATSGLAALGGKRWPIRLMLRVAGGLARR
jgi:uncharacterized RDD family membrane protein YckC